MQTLTSLEIFEPRRLKNGLEGTEAKHSLILCPFAPATQGGPPRQASSLTGAQYRWWAPYPHGCSFSGFLAGQHGLFLGCPEAPPGAVVRVELVWGMQCAGFDWVTPRTLVPRDQGKGLAGREAGLVNPQTSSHPQPTGPGELNLEPDSGVWLMWRNWGPSYLEVLQPPPEGCTPPSALAWGGAA